MLAEAPSIKTPEVAAISEAVEATQAEQVQAGPEAYAQSAETQTAQVTPIAEDRVVIDTITRNGPTFRRTAIRNHPHRFPIK